MKQKRLISRFYPFRASLILKVPLILFAVLCFLTAYSQQNGCDEWFPGEWCHECPNDPSGYSGWSECKECLDHPDELMQNASSAKTKPRMLYVNDFIGFLSNKPSDPEFAIADIDPPENKTILGQPQREVELLQYACDAGFDGLILYNIGPMLRRGSAMYEDPYGVGTLTYPQELQKFIMIAEQVYDLEIGIATSEGSDMWKNMSNLYDHQVLNYSWPHYLEPFNEELIDNCGNGWRIDDPGGSGIGGYFQVGDFDPVYPPDGEGNYHPLDHILIDLMNIYRFQRNSTRDHEDWFPLIWDAITEQNYDLFDEDWCFWKCNRNPDDEHVDESFEYEYDCFQSHVCPGYKRIVTEHEFWKRDDELITTENIAGTTHEIYDIEEAYTEFMTLLEMIHCLNDQLNDDIVYDFVECPVKADAYIIQLASAGVTHDGEFNGAKHYVIGSEWNAPHNTILNYDFETVNQNMADEIDGMVDRIYLATYRKTPCHLWSDDVLPLNQSYRRRFKDVYAYFADNGIGAVNGQTEIYPLFSSRHYAIEDVHIRYDPGEEREHLGLYLSSSGPYANDNGFIGSIGGAESIFDHFAHEPVINTGCDFSSFNPDPSAPLTYTNPYATINAPVNLSSNVTHPCVHPGAVVLLDNVIAGRRYSVETDVVNDRITVRGPSISGEVITYGNSLQGRSADFTAPYSGTYYMHISRGSFPGCPVNNHPDASTCRELKVKRIEYPYYQTLDPNPKAVDEYDNIFGGYAWYRYTELGGINTSFPHEVYKKPVQVEKAINREIEPRIYPNPADDYIRVEGQARGSYLLFDITGQQVSGGKFTTSIIPLSRIVPGTYFLRLEDEDRIYTFPVIIQR